jgi:hypothetical protein
MAKRTNNTGGGRRPAGGIGSRVVVEKPVRTGQNAREMRPAGVAQYGAAIGNKATDHAGVLRGGVEPVVGQRKPISVVLGNEKALDVGCGGPGTGREVMRSGSQGQHGPVAGTTKPEGRDVLSAFGPDVPNRR